MFPQNSHQSENTVFSDASYTISLSKCDWNNSIYAILFCTPYMDHLIGQNIDTTTQMIVLLASVSASWKNNPTPES